MMYYKKLTWGIFRQFLLDENDIHYHFVVKQKHWLHIFIGWLWAKLNINEHYMTDYFTVIGNQIAVPENSPIKWPEDESSLMPSSAVELYAHERVHTFQQKKDGKLKWMARYLFSKRWRAEYEFEAYATSAFVAYRHGRMFNLEWLKKTLVEGYAIPEELAQQQVDRVEDLIRRYGLGYVRYIDWDLSGFLDEYTERASTIEGLSS